MPLSDVEMQELRAKLDRAGLPVTFTGDRLAAFQMGIDVVLNHLRQKPEGKKKDD